MDSTVFQQLPRFQIQQRYAGNISWRQRTCFNCVAHPANALLFDVIVEGFHL
jgi:hypothetical protein